MRDLIVQTQVNSSFGTESAGHESQCLSSASWEALTRQHIGYWETGLDNESQA